MGWADFLVGYSPFSESSGENCSIYLVNSWLQGDGTPIAGEGGIAFLVDKDGSASLPAIWRLAVDAAGVVDFAK